MLALCKVLLLQRGVSTLSAIPVLIVTFIVESASAVLASGWGQHSR